MESRLLKKYEKIIAKKGHLVALNDKDKLTYQKVLAATDIKFLPVFLPFDEVTSKTGKGSFCLYHGNLSVAENEKAALWLLKNVFSVLNIPFIIAGKNPSATLKSESLKNKNVQLVANPSQQEMHELIQNAHLHLLPSFNVTGIKIKLLNALFNGRFIVSNSASIEGTGLETLCNLAEAPSDYIKITKELFHLSFTEKEVSEKNEVLKKQFNNEKNARQLINWL
jgi:hypothetical protein